MEGQDFRLVTSQIRMFPSTPLSIISFAFIDDRIGQEDNEIFQLRFDTIPSTATNQIIEEPFAVQDTLSATIIDGDGKSQFFVTTVMSPTILLLCSRHILVFRRRVYSY